MDSFEVSAHSSLGSTELDCTHSLLGSTELDSEVESYTMEVQSFSFDQQFQERSFQFEVVKADFQQ